MELTREEEEILRRMHESIDYIIRTHKEYFDALAEFDKTGVLKVHGKVLYVRKHGGAEASIRGKPAEDPFRA